MTMRRQGVERGRSGTLLAAMLLLGLGAASPARAQFTLFGLGEVSPQDVSDTIAEHGFRLVGPLYRNGRVYLADVIDRRQRRERLVISAENGQIMQRFFVDVGPERRGAPAYVSRPAPRDDSFFSHLTRGWDDEPPPRPPVGLTGPGDMAAPALPPPAARPKPRVVTRTDVAPVTTSPLPPPAGSTVPGPAPQTPASSKPEVVAVPAGNGAPAASGPAPSGVRGTSVSTDPLRIPGTRKPDDAKPAPAAATVATKAPEPAPVSKPKAAAPASDVPVAPLD